MHWIAPSEKDAANDMLEKRLWADGELQFMLPDALKVRPISHHGNVNEIIGRFGGTDQPRNAVNQPQTLPNAA